MPSKPAQQEASEPAGQGAGIPAKQPIAKATFYLSAANIDALDEAQRTLRKLAGSRRGELSKSAIVDAALTIVAQDLAEHGADSQLARILVKQ
jgi:hypothetical protein